MTLTTKRKILIFISLLVAGVIVYGAWYLFWSWWQKLDDEAYERSIRKWKDKSYTQEPNTVSR